jgi:hypothetical protein
MKMGVSYTTWPLFPEERDHVVNWIRTLVGQKAGMDVVMQRKILFYLESNPGHPASS